MMQSKNRISISFNSLYCLARVADFGLNDASFFTTSNCRGDESVTRLADPLRTRRPR